MKPRISRRDFLKLTGLGAAASAVLGGRGPCSRYARLQAHASSPDYSVTGERICFATTCGECPAGCGLIVHTMDGRAYRVEGNPEHPVTHGRVCARGQASLQGLYNPDRIQGPVKKGGSSLDWEAAVEVIKIAFEKYAPGEIAFLMGLFPDHLHDLVQILSRALGGALVYRFDMLGELEARVTLMDAAQRLFGTPKIPYFDLQAADVIFSFGANFTETWLSPVNFAYPYGTRRQGCPGEGGYLVQFEPRRSQVGARADEWMPIKPGSEARLAQVLARLAADVVSGVAKASYSQVDVNAAAEEIGLPVSELERLARIFVQAPRKLAIPGGVSLGHAHGLAAAEAILALNLVGDNPGKAGGLFLLPDAPLYTEFVQRPSTIAEVGGLCEQMKSGKIKALFVHGANPTYTLPGIYGFQEALENVELVVSFASFPDEIALQADYIFPDRTPLESWGYQKIVTGSDRPAISGLQPVIAPLYDTRASADVLLEAARAVGGELAARVSFQDEVDFLQKSVAVLCDQGGVYASQDLPLFWALWREHGGWWKKAPALLPPVPIQGLEVYLGGHGASLSGGEEEYELQLLPFLYPCLADGSQPNWTVLQETPAPTSSTTLNTWIEINPQTARQVGVQSGEVVIVSSRVGEIEAVVVETADIQPGTVAIPLGRGHTVSGNLSAGWDANPLNLLGREQNESGNLAFMATRVKVTPAGKRRGAALASQKGDQIA